MAFTLMKPYIPSKKSLEKSNGNCNIPFTEIDTDGYYGSNFTGAVAVIPAIGSKKIWNLSKIAECSTEMEWASVGLGIRFGLDKNQTLIALSNDNLSVIKSLICNRPMKQEYALFWYTEIQKMIAETMGFKIRWVPREINRAGRGPEYEEIYQSHFIYKRPTEKNKNRNGNGNDHDTDWRR